MRRADRLLRIIQLLRRHRRPVTGQRMAEELEVSLRTLYRDIADLITDGVPIRGEAGVGYVLGEGYDLPPLMFKADELEAIMLGLSWVERRGDKVLQLASADVVAKIGTVLPEALRPFFYDAPLLTAPRYNELVDRIDLSEVRSAIRTQRKLSIVYQDERGEATNRVIWPIAITYFDPQRLLVGWCELRRGFRHFRTDRISAMTQLEEKYREPRLRLMSRWKEERAREQHQS
ncbi:helix-turn-helix transcriptional regulator [Aestuariivirga litoralis]|uniref:helix-turn-helix transcriptional regulator n=1 Tax=Aestuariivirga litoralis TaxID=2650924 RepID=UPI0018C62165|nr:YafY family protein [Aestuariivirga litoralis]MBG1231226.1 YafY family transcriptional regulator [Aestuariivirga litoralis]